MKKGFFITIEGPDGAGKTSLLDNLMPALRDIFGDNLIETREPGGVRISEAIRKIVLGLKYPEMNRRTEALLFAAARAQHMVEKIEPALADGKIVLSDRFVDSSIAYQGGGRELGIEAVSEINNFATNGLQPNLTLLLDLPSEVGIARIMKHRSDEVNRLDKDRLVFHKKVRQTYLQLAKDQPNRIKVLDATQSPEKIAINALQLIQESLKGWI
ncbi:dTMP kinase [Oenococcus oeni]|uniref:Thymidylate kinase n=2 Tax=Oenococcus oeni TaxID=1247 RepID=A0A3S7H8W5_OENOE|nr:dTMP kinase [Oenococcus oeni]EAV39674.1 thymidylate kinase [Oenococcus oeni ATCC BAA-1163]AVI94561.1 thymidylate kinase [Oenococcus oeni]KDP19679.1 thymidylate kinase [Oenococcus oeni]KGH65949.1 thymidylate kinase [Oenococcus oeni IOEB_C23]KGH72154.1 thymidylate kinase [Oenococcus oeni IOEB_0502]